MRLTFRSLVALALAGAAWVCAGCGKEEQGADSNSTPAKTSAPQVAAEWGSIEGRVVYQGELPNRRPLVVDKDKEHCLPSDGSPLSEDWVVNGQNKGVKWAVVFLRPAKGRFALPEDLKTPAVPQVELDQPRCVFKPHVLAMRKEQTLLAKNPDGIPHNVVAAGVVNSFNVQVPKLESLKLEMRAESGPIKLSCGAHPWMSAYAWVFEHPYFAVTDENGYFKIPKVPAGKQFVVVWHEAAAADPKGYPWGQQGKAVEIKVGTTVTNLGEIPVKAIE
jgi:hypothetical protein